MDDNAILRQLRTGLEDGSLLHEGRVLPERQLGARLGTSRARLRRALSVLEAEGAIFRRQGQGTFAAPPPAVETGTLQTLARQVTPFNILEVRLELEPALAGLAAQRASSDELATLERLMQTTLGAADTAGYEAADEIFHFKIAELAHNPLFLTIYQSIRAVRRNAQWTDRRRETYSAERIAQLARQHQNLCRHIAERNPGLAARAMEEHLIAVSSVMHRERRSTHLRPAFARRADATWST